jgi:hypothetical protein
MAKSYEQLNEEMLVLQREMMHLPFSREEARQLFDLLSGKEEYSGIASRLKRALESPLPPLS